MSLGLLETNLQIDKTIQELRRQLDETTDSWLREPISAKLAEAYRKKQLQIEQGKGR